MTKYRTLSLEELDEFKDEFISFLVINGIEAKDWESIKKVSLDKANKIIDNFSDVVFESIFRKSVFLKHISHKSVKCFQCLENEIVLLGLDATIDSKVNFLSDLPLNKIITENTSEIKVYQTKKAYNSERELEMFNMVSKGAEISNGDLFKKVALLF